MQKLKERKKVNYMVDCDTLVRIEELVPPGKRSDFVNGALKEAILQYGRRRAFEDMEKLRKEVNLSMTTREIIKLKNYGRL